ncbi:MAG: fibronectin type III domain-containing protein [Thermoplasmatota archaeon]
MRIGRCSLFVIGLIVLSPTPLVISMEEELTEQVDRSPEREMNDTITGSGSVFCENLGQIEDGDILFHASTPSARIGISKDSILLIKSEREDTEEEMHTLGSVDPAGLLRDRDTSIIRIDLEDTNNAIPKGFERTGWSTNFLIGSSSDEWVIGAPNYNRISFEGIWPDVDLHLSFNGPLLRWEFDAGYGKLIDLDRVKVRAPSRSGPIPFEEIFSERFPTRSDPKDPLVFSTYLGGSGWDDGWSMALDNEGFSYISRYTDSLDFPITSYPFDGSYNGGNSDVFITKMAPDGGSLIYSTYLGGDGYETATCIEVDDRGRAYIGGVTGSQDFPTTNGAFDRTLYPPDLDGFLARLSPEGDILEMSTFIGGSDDDSVNRICIDKQGSIYATGMTSSSDLPATETAFDNRSNGGLADIFVAKFDPEGSSLIACTYIGGSGDDQPYGMDIDGSGSVYISAETSSKDFPTTEGAFDTYYNGGERDVSISKLNPDLSVLVYSTYLGGGGNEYSQDIEVDNRGFVHAVGMTSSNDFPTTKDAYDRYHNKHKDCYITKLNISGDRLIYSTFIGGEYDDIAYGIDLDEQGYPYIIGTTSSLNFPTTDLVHDRTHNGGITDAFITKLSQDGSSLRYSTYFGGSGEDWGLDIHCDEHGCAYITGETDSRDLPTTLGALNRTYKGGEEDVYVARLNLSTIPTAPRNLRLTSGDAHILLDWDGPKEKGGPADVRYKVYRGDMPGRMGVIQTLNGTCFNDTSLVNGQKYYYQVSAGNDLGESGKSNRVAGIPAAVPGSPRDLHAVSGDGTVTLNWKPPAVSGGLSITGYVIYRGASASEMTELEGTGNVLEFTDEPLVNGRTYHYCVSAVTPVGEGPVSGTVATIPSSRPGPVLDISATSGDTIVNIVFGPPADDGGLDILHYNIYRGIGEEDVVLYEEVRDAGSFIDRNVTNGATYSFGISAVNRRGEGRMGDMVSATPGSVPGVLTNISSTARDEMIDINWDPPRDDGGFDIGVYNLYMVVDDNGSMELHSTIRGRTNLTISDLENGVIYRFCLTAVNDIGEGEHSEVIEAVPVSVPEAPFRVELNRVSGGIRISWIEPFDDGGSPVLYYNIYGGAPSDGPVLLKSNCTGNNYTYTVAEPGTYYYSVSAVNEIGEGGRTIPKNITISDAETDDDSKERTSALLISALVVVPLLMVIIGVAVIILFLKRKRSRDSAPAPPRFDKFFK